MNTNTSESSQSPAFPPSNSRRRRFPPWPTLVVIVLCILGIAALRGAEYWPGLRRLVDAIFGAMLGPNAARMEQAVFNVICLPLALIGSVALAIWFVFRSAYTERVRYGGAMGVMLLLAVLSASLRLEQVSGELMPRFRFRWQRHADELLEKPAARAGNVDLATTTSEDFPQFLGPERSASVFGVALARDWERQPPQELWRVRSARAGRVLPP